MMSIIVIMCTNICHVMSWLDMTWYNVMYFHSLCEVMWCDVMWYARTCLNSVKLFTTNTIIFYIIIIVEIISLYSFHNHITSHHITLHYFPSRSKWKYVTLYHVKSSHDMTWHILVHMIRIIDIIICYH